MSTSVPYVPYVFLKPKCSIEELIEVVPYVPYVPYVFLKPKCSIEELIEVVAERLDLKPKLICSGSRQQKIAEARALVAYLAVEETGHSAAEVAGHLGISRMGVQKAVIRGREFGKHEVFPE